MRSKITKMFTKYKRYFSPFIIGLILTACLLWPLAAAPYFTHQDDVQWSRIYEMDTCIKDLQIPCRWVPDLGDEYGYPLFNFYAPLPYYIGEIFYFITHQLFLSAKIMFALPFIGCYIFMYLFARKVWGNVGGAISGIFYSYLPYHALDFYVRGAMGELWALMFYPAITWSILRIREKASISNMVICALSFTGLFLSHNLSTMIFLPFIALIVGVFVIYQKLWKTHFLLTLILAGILALLLSAFYILPALTEKNLVHLETITEGYFHYTEHFKGLKKLFLDYSWGYGASEREYPGGPNDGLSYQIGWVHLIGWVLALYSAFILWHTHRKRSLLIILSSISIGISIFMIHPISAPVWNLLPPLVYLQFPWRFLGVVGFFICFLSGAIFFCLPQIVHKKKRYYFISLATVMVIGVVALNFNFFRPESFVYKTDAEVLSGKSWENAITRSNFEYLPIFAKAPPPSPAIARYTILSGDAFVRNFKQGSDWMSFDVNAKNLTFLQLSQYYFPNWKITVDNKPVSINYQNPLGLMSIFLDPGSHHVTARLHNTSIRTIGNLLTLFGFLVLLFIWFYKQKLAHHFFSYLVKGLNK